MINTITIEYMINDMNNFDLFINKQKLNILHLKKTLIIFFSK
jgi:hypothetical protein